MFVKMCDSEQCVHHTCGLNPGIHGLFAFLTWKNESKKKKLIIFLPQCFKCEIQTKVSNGR